MEETLNQISQNLPEWLNWKSIGGVALLVLGFFFAIRMLAGIVRLVLTVLLIGGGLWLLWHFGINANEAAPAINP